MITLKGINVPTLKKTTASSDDKTENGYLTIDTSSSNKSKSINLSANAVKSVGINLADLNKDNLAYLAIYPEQDNSSKDFVVNWFISQFSIVDKADLKTTIKTEKYPAYRLAKFNKAKRNINSKPMHTILIEEFNEETIMLTKVTEDKYMLTSKSQYDAANEVPAKIWVTDTSAGITTATETQIPTGVTDDSDKGGPVADPALSHWVNNELIDGTEEEVIEEVTTLNAESFNTFKIIEEDGQEEEETLTEEVLNSEWPSPFDNDVMVANAPKNEVDTFLSDKFEVEVTDEEMSL
jgi:hypothetical protein